MGASKTKLRPPRLPRPLAKPKHRKHVQRRGKIQDSPPSRGARKHQIDSAQTSSSSSSSTQETIPSITSAQNINRPVRPPTRYAGSLPDHLEIRGKQRLTAIACMHTSTSGTPAISSFSAPAASPQATAHPGRNASKNWSSPSRKTGALPPEPGGAFASPANQTRGRGHVAPSRAGNGNRLASTPCSVT